jgi:hypothetical protein
MGMVSRVAMSALDGGLDPALEFRVRDEPADQPGYSENDGLWVYDDEQSVGIHTWLGHSGAQYPDAFERVSVFLPGGELLVHTELGAQTTNEWPAGPGLVVQCEEPYRRWRHTYRGTARPTTAAELRAGMVPADREPVPLEIDAVATMTAPPWVQGSFHESKDEYLATQAARFYGGFRFEQLLRGEVTVRIGEGAERRELRFAGPGLRTHRKGARVMGKDGSADAYPGHVWMDAVFPSGRAIYVMLFAGADGLSPDGGEHWVREGDVFHRARLVGPPVFRTSLPGEEHLAFDLQTDELGTVHVEGDLVANSFAMLGGRMPDWWGIQWDLAGTPALAMNQGIVRYRCDGEVACNMIERSIPIDQVPPTDDQRAEG